MNVWTLTATTSLVIWQLVLLMLVSGSESLDAKQLENAVFAKQQLKPIEVLELPSYHPVRIKLGSAAPYSPPDFTQFADSKEKKEAFYNYLLPMIHDANKEVVQERQWLFAMADKLLSGQALSDSQLKGIEIFEQRYAIRSKAKTVAGRIGTLLLSVDVVPASLIVAQAAKESGWGTSRFATEGNNYFGIWCFYRGCGLKPLRRDDGRAHEVATFGSVAQGVRYYVRTINTHVAYTDLRQVRAKVKRQSETVKGVVLAAGLIRYSERGMAYVKEIQSMIRYNNMQRFTRNYSV